MSQKAAFVTGGTGALGRAVTLRLLTDGHSVAVTYRSEAEWRDLERGTGGGAAAGRLLGIPADVTEEDSVRAAVALAVERMGGLSVLAHIAGGYAGGTPVEALDAKTLRGMLDLNLVSAFWSAKHVIPHLKRAGWGRLLFVSSRGAIEAYAGAAAYAAAKLGLHALVGTLAKELRESGITANAVMPSIIDTPANRASMPGADFSKWVRPEAVADLVAFLVSESAAATSGVIVPVYGRA